MEGDSAVTFAMRLPSAEKYTLLYFDRGRGHCDFKDLSNEKAMTVAKQSPSGLLELGESVQEYVLFEQRGDRYFVVDTNF